jgi:hypothetical protein
LVSNTNIARCAVPIAIGTTPALGAQKQLF